MKTVSNLFEPYKDVNTLNSRQLQGMFRSLYNAPKLNTDLKDSKSIPDNKTANDAYSAITEQGIERPIQEESKQPISVEIQEESKQPISVESAPGQANINNTDILNNITNNIKNEEVNENAVSPADNITNIINNIDKGNVSIDNIIDIAKNISEIGSSPDVNVSTAGTENINDNSSVVENTNLGDQNINNIEKKIEDITKINNVSNISTPDFTIGGDSNVTNVTNPSNNTTINKDADKFTNISLSSNDSDDISNQSLNMFNDVINKYLQSEKLVSLPGFDKGGVTEGPSIAGERGPEAVIPLPDGKNVPVQVTLTGTDRSDKTELKAEPADKNDSQVKGIEAAREKDGENVAAAFESANKVAGTVKSELSKMPTAMSNAIQGGAGAGGAGSNIGSQGPIPSLGGVGDNVFNPIKTDQRQGVDSDFGGIRDPAYGQRIKAWERIRGEIAFITTT